MDDRSDGIMEVVSRFWGFDTLRPLQDDAIRAALEGRDSLVVLPTGGGKSLCYQVPPIVADRLDVVVSPLISLMKDQVDGLRQAGYPAAALHSGLAPAERASVNEDLSAGRIRLLFASPERLANDGFRCRLAALGVESFAIDEAHCISHWGHDFRPEYRRLCEMREVFPEAAFHAFTATATPRVREDIARQLRLRDPEVLVGRFDRPNLTYRVVPRLDTTVQVGEVVARHENEAVIVYAISRADTEQLATSLTATGVKAAPYHAGLNRTARQRTQEQFANEQLDVVVATVAFGMGIDRSNVRAVVHAAVPKSIEHYQQETGRAGRDGLPAECVLLYSAADVERWRSLLERSAAEAGLPADSEHVEAQVELLRGMQGLCTTLECRHAKLTRYFGQTYETEGCGACDVCLGEVQSMPGATAIARKILAGVARLEQRFGVGYVVKVLRGADVEEVRRRGHDQLSTFGLLRELPEKVVQNLVYQLIDQSLLARTPGDRPVVVLTPDGVEAMRGDRDVRLLEPRVGHARRSRGDAESWEGVDRPLFDRLRELRREIATDRNVPPYVVFSDRTLRDLARLRPLALGAMRIAHGVGERKLADFGPRFIEEIKAFVAGDADNHAHADADRTP